MAVCEGHEVFVIMEREKRFFHRQLTEVAVDEARKKGVATMEESGEDKTF